MRPPKKNYFHYRSSQLNVFSYSHSGIDVLFRVDLRAFLCFTPHEINSFLHRTRLRDPAKVANTRNLPQRKLIALSTDQVPEFTEIKPIKDIRKAVAMLAMTDLAGYAPDRPVVLSADRLKRDLVFCMPYRYYEND